METTTHRLGSGLQMRVATAGSGAPLLWLHGLHGVPENDPVVAALAMRFRVIAPVAPGFDDLSELDDVRDVHDLAFVYDDLLAVLGLASARVVGHSFGAMIAAELAAHVPARVERLALLAPVGMWRDDAPAIDLFARPYPAMDAVLWAAGKASGPMAEGVAGAAPNQVERLVTIARGLTCVAKFLWPLPDKGLRRRLYRVGAPTLVMHGDRDAVVPLRYAQDLSAGIREARLETMTGAGHMLPYEQVDAVISQLSGFMK